MRARLWSGILLAALLAPLRTGAQVPDGHIASHAPASRAELEQASRAAMSAMRKGDFAAAIRDFEKLTRMAPGVAEFYANLGLAYYSAGRLKEAVAPCRKALELKPSLASAHYFLGISLAESGQCGEALPYLEEDYGRVKDPQFKRAMGLDGARCGMALGEPFKAVGFLQGLDRDFPNDPNVLYLTAHIFSDLSTRASQRLLHVAPGSIEAHQFNAEVLEMQGKLEDAIDEYRKVLAMNPRLPGIHYHIGRLLLAGESGAAGLEAARREFEDELRINPADARSEYELGEMAREARKWDVAIEHFGRAAKIDPDFPEALVGLGKSLVSAGRAPEAVAPLERAVELAPQDSVAHYQLSFAYLRVGRDTEAKRQLALYRELHEKQQRASLAIRLGLVGDISKPQTAEPPE